VGRALINNVGRSFIALAIAAFVVGLLTPSIVDTLTQKASAPTPSPTGVTPIPTATPIPTHTTAPPRATATSWPYQPTATAIDTIATPGAAPIVIIPSVKYVFALGDWFIEVRIVGSSGSLIIGYIGSEPLTVENPLLPIAAGLSVELIYSDPSRNTVIRRPGTYYNATMTISPGTTDSITFDAEGLIMIRVSGRILGKIPVYIEIPVGSSQMVTDTVIDTDTQIPGSATVTTATSIPYSCRVVKVSEYPEPRSREVVITETGDETAVSDGVVEIRIPAKISGSIEIPITLTNIGGAALFIHVPREFTVINATEDGVHYITLDITIGEPVPTITLPPQLQECMYNIPPGTEIVYPSSILLEPSDRATIKAPLLSDVLEKLISGYNFYRGWIYIKMKLTYTAIRELYRIEADNAYSITAAKPYSTKEIEFTFRVYIDLSTQRTG